MLDSAGKRVAEQGQLQLMNDDSADQQNSRDKLRSVYAPINGDVKSLLGHRCLRAR